MSKDGQEKIYSMVTDKILNLLEEGTVPWHKPWRTVDDFPKNLVSKKPYRGINVWMLAFSPFSSPWWLSYKQAKSLGGNVKEGEKSTPIIFWKWIDITDKETGDDKKIPFMRYYAGFNSDQCEGIEEKIPVPENADQLEEFDPIDCCDQVWENYPKKPLYKEAGNIACYNPLSDLITMPPRKRFDSPVHFYGTFFHEMVHSTGHEERLKREGVAERDFMNQHEYSKEELVAEMGAAMLCGTCGIENKLIENSASYINTWMQRIRDDKKLIISASSQAQKAVDHVLGKEWSND